MFNDAKTGLYLPNRLKGGMRSRQRGFLCGFGFFGSGSDGGGSTVWQTGLLFSTGTKTSYGYSTGGVIASTSKTSGRYCFGLKLDSFFSPQQFMGGVAKTSTWGSSYHMFDNGQNFTGYVNQLDLYPGGTSLLNQSTPTAVNDILYFDFNLTAGTMALKLNGGAWSSAATLTGYSAGEGYSICAFAPSTSFNTVGYTLLTTAAELAGNIPSGASSWD